MSTRGEDSRRMAQARRPIKGWEERIDLAPGDTVVSTVTERRTVQPNGNTTTVLLVTSAYGRIYRVALENG